MYCISITITNSLLSHFSFTNITSQPGKCQCLQVLKASLVFEVKQVPLVDERRTNNFSL